MLRERGLGKPDRLRERTHIGFAPQTPDSIEQCYRTRPAAGAGLHLMREAGDGETIRRKLFQVAQLLHVAIRNFAAGLVTLPDDRGIVRLLPALARVEERRVPAPGVDASNPHAARGEIERRLAPHAAARGEIFVGAHATRRARVDQHDVEGFQLMADALEFGLDLGRGGHVAVGQAAELRAFLAAKAKGSPDTNR